MIHCSPNAASSDFGRNYRDGCAGSTRRLRACNRTWLRSATVCLLMASPETGHNGPLIATNLENKRK